MSASTPITTFAQPAPPSHKPENESNRGPEGPSDALRLKDYGVDIPSTMGFFDPSSLDPPGSKPIQDFTAQPPNKPRNWSLISKDVTVKDMRKLRDEKGDRYVNVDTTGFECRELGELNELKDPDWTNGEWIRDYYFPLTQRWLSKRFGVDPSKVILMNAQVRNPLQSPFVYNIDCEEYRFYGTPKVTKFEKRTDGEPDASTIYSPLAHTDGYHRIFNDAIEEYAPNGERLRLIGVWKPIEHDLWDIPLAIADCQTGKTEDYVPYTLKFPEWTDDKNVMEGFESDGYLVTGDTKMDWYAPVHQKTSELLLFKHYDSQPTNPLAVRAAHTAFKDHRYYGKEGFPQRESVEMRVFVIGGE